MYRGGRFFKICLSPSGGVTGNAGQTAGEGQGQQAEQTSQSESQNTQQSQQNQQGTSSVAALDYTKIQQMLDNTLAAKEETTLKAYFKQKGLSQQEAEQAMDSFKTEKAKNQPDNSALQAQLLQAQEEVKKAQVESSATLVAIQMGIDAKTIPYLLKLVDFEQAAVLDKDGKIKEEAIKAAFQKILEEVPALKPQTSQATGFVQVGASGGQGQAAGGMDADLKKAFGL